MNFADLRNVAGLLIITALPYMSGYMLKTLFNKRETGQIETYLTGFFLVFLIQGAYFSVGDLFLEISFDGLCSGFNIVIVSIAVLFVISVIVNLVLGSSRDSEDKSVYRQKLKKEDWILLAIMLAVAVFVCFRIFNITDYLRDDHMLPTVRTTLRSGSINVINPIISKPYEAGLITSKKFITLPVYYAYLCRTFGFDTIVLLYIIITLQTVACTYFSCMLFMGPVLKLRSKMYIYGIFLGAVILSGDYYMQSSGAKLLWSGYNGSTIVLAVMLPYVMYITMSGYNAGRLRVLDVLRLILTFVSSVFITGVATGALLIAIVAMISTVCFIIIGRNRDGETEKPPAVVGE